MNDIKKKLEIGKNLLSALRIVCQECDGEGVIYRLHGMTETRHYCSSCDGGYIALDSSVTLFDADDNEFDAALSLISYFLQDWRDYSNRVWKHSIIWLNEFDYERTGSFGRMKERGIARHRTITTFGRWLEINSDVLDEVSRELDEIGLDLRMCLEMHADKSEMS